MAVYHAPPTHLLVKDSDQSQSAGFIGSKRIPVYRGTTKCGELVTEAVRVTTLARYATCVKCVPAHGEGRPS